MILNNNPIGLKLWSVNTDYYYEEAKKLYSQQYFDYIELYIVPDTLEYLPKWIELSKQIPINLHAPHYMHGFNLADKEKREHNFSAYTQVKTYADALNAQYIIFHLGIDGNIEESASQLEGLQEPRAIIENKPYKIPHFPMRQCRGSTIKEIQFIINRVSSKFCLDIGHGICSANAQQVEPYAYLAKFNQINPVCYHISDNFQENLYDAHLHLGTGTYDFNQIISLLKPNTFLMLETDKDSISNLNDFKQDILWIRKKSNV